MEGRDEAILIKVDPTAKKLSTSHHLIFPGVRFPSHAAFDSEDRLWVVGGAPLEGSRSSHIGVAKKDLAAEGAVHHKQDSFPERCVPVKINSIS